MRQTRKRRYGTLLPVAALIVCAIAARVVARYGYHMTLLGIVRAVIYIGLLRRGAFPSGRASFRRRCAGICWRRRG